MFPAGEAKPLASNLNFAAHRTVANLVVAKVGAGGAISNFNAQGTTDIVPNLVIVKLGAGGRLSFFNDAGTTDVLADVAGWFDGG